MISLAQVTFVTPKKSNLEIYLEKPCVKYTDLNFDIMEWWKIYVLKFKILSKMTKYIFIISITIVAFESSFNVGGHVLSDYKIFISPITLDALVCSRNWIRDSYRPLKGPMIMLSLH